jgi:hypothetical protein
MSAGIVRATDDSDSRRSYGHTMTTHHAQTTSDENLGTIALALGIAGFVPPLLILGSIAATVCGYLSRASARGRVGLVLGVIGIAAPFVALFVYCVILGYPWPIHRYHAGS